MAAFDLLPAVPEYVDQGFGPTTLTFEIPDPNSPTGFTHTGIDVGQDSCYGTPVIATRPGTVWAVGAQWVRWRDGSGYGSDSSSFGAQAVSFVDYLSGNLVLAGHLFRADVTPGQQFPAGAQLGLAGGWPNSGQGVSTGPHVHLEVQPKGGAFLDPATALDPGPYLRFERRIRTMRVVTSYPLGSGPIYVVCPSGKYELGTDAERDDWLRLCGQAPGTAGLDLVGQYTLDRLPVLTRLPG